MDIVKNVLRYYNFELNMKMFCNQYPRPKMMSSCEPRRVWCDGSISFGSEPGRALGITNWTIIADNNNSMQYHNAQQQQQQQNTST